MSVDQSTETGSDPFPRIDFDHHSPEYRANWRAISDEHLARCPVARTDAYGGFWVVSDHAGVSQVMRDDATFSSGRNSEDPSDPRQGIVIPPNPITQIPLELDPPEYNPYRRIMSPYFSPSAARDSLPFVEQATDALLDRVCASGRIDLVLDYGNPLPALATMKLIGLPLDDWQTYAEPMHRVAASPPSDPDFPRNVQIMGQLGGAIAAQVPKLREEPGEGLLSGLATATIDGKPLPVEEVVSAALLVIQGGVHTTTALFAHTMVWLADHPDHRAALLADPSLWEHATEEFLRVFPPAMGFARTATRDVVLGGQQIRAGDRVMMSFAAANRDPAVFPDPDEVRLDRSPNRHTSFGLGIHRCIGLNHARVWFPHLVRRVLDRMPDIAIDRDATRQNESVGVINGFVSMPATFTPHEPLGVTMPN
ncbi:cytochrome P450 [Plantactinospora sp. BC1]|uniref:cytochrome P450 n=1 Tax=Plantactinospora sp. BC1 TaxID=2108470 RepID=UPI000D175184|nr:cytochrome P450 [Plantactinospora sp. BC1]AVT28799.1 cytochrome P450 [Plantactinospora sp. BC1]